MNREENLTRKNLSTPTQAFDKCCAEGNNGWFRNLIQILNEIFTSRAFLLWAQPVHISGADVVSSAEYAHEKKIYFLTTSVTSPRVIYTPETPCKFAIGYFALKATAYLIGDRAGAHSIIMQTKALHMLV